MLEFVNAPPLAIPVPFKVKGFVIAVAVPYPLRSSAAALMTVTAPLEAPKAAAFATFNVPALIVVPPA